MCQSKNRIEIHSLVAFNMNIELWMSDVCTEGPHITRILGLGKNYVMWNSRKLELFTYFKLIDKTISLLKTALVKSGLVEITLVEDPCTTKVVQGMKLTLTTLCREITFSSSPHHMKRDGSCPQPKNAQKMHLTWQTDSQTWRNIFKSSGDPGQVTFQYKVSAQKWPLKLNFPFFLHGYVGKCLYFYIINVCTIRINKLTEAQKNFVVTSACSAQYS